MQEPRRWIGALALLAALAAAPRAADEPIELPRGETHLAVEAGATYALRVPAVPGGCVLSVQNFTGETLQLVPATADDALVVESGLTARGTRLGADAEVDATLTAEAGGDVWLYVLGRDGAELEASRSLPMLVSRARFLERCADELRAAGDEAGARQHLYWSATDLGAAWRFGDARERMAEVVEASAATSLELEALAGLAEIELLAGERDAALATARRALDLAGDDDATAWLRFLAARVAARAERAPEDVYRRAITMSEALEPVAGQVPDLGLEVMLLLAESLARMDRADDADALEQRAWQHAQALPAAVAREAYARQFDRWRERHADRERARAVLDRLEQLATNEFDEVEDLRKRATITPDPGGAAELLAEACTRAAGLGVPDRIAALRVAHGRALARAGFADAGRDLVEAARDALDDSWHPEIRYVCLRADGVTRAEALARRVHDPASLEWTREWNAALAALEDARRVAVEIGLREAVDEVDFYLAHVEALAPERLTDARARAHDALRSGRTREDAELVAAVSLLLADVTDDVGARRAHVRDAITASARIGAPRAELNARAMAARLALEAGDFAAFAEQRRAAQPLARTIVDRSATADELSRRLSQTAGPEAWATVDQDWVAARLAADAADHAALADGLASADLWAHVGLASAPPVDARLDDVVERLPADTLVLRYADGGGRLYVYVVSADGVRHRVVGDRHDLTARATAFARGISSRAALDDAATVAARGHALWRELVADVVPHETLDACDRIVVVGTPWMTRLPFEALAVEPVDAPRGFGDVVFALDAYTLHYAASLADALDAVADPIVPMSLLVAADPIADGSVATVRGREFAALPGARDEARAIEALLGERVDLRVGERVRRAELLADLGRFEAMHFAVHGLASDDPRQSGLVLADGLLSTEDIRALDLSAELIVLSACDTAGGRLRLAQRVDSLANAFRAAGARNVVATLWPVQDAAAVPLMVRFYEEFAQRGASAAEALTAARRFVRATPVDQLVAGSDDAERGRRLRSRGANVVPDGHPYLWAPFVFLGPAR